MKSFYKGIANDSDPLLVGLRFHIFSVGIPSLQVVIVSGRDFSRESPAIDTLPGILLTTSSGVLMEVLAGQSEAGRTNLNTTNSRNKKSKTRDGIVK